MFRKLAVLTLLAAAPAAAQVQSRPTDPPLVTAVNESWFQLREPIQVAGELYYPAGARVFFDRNTMVRTGHYNGVPLYADTTLEPFSIVYVPVTRGLMQPYERRRRGDLAGTTGSRTPSFPVATSPTMTAVPAAAAAPTEPPMPAGALGVYTPDTSAPATTMTATRPAAAGRTGATPGAVGTTGVVTAGSVATRGRVMTRRQGIPLVSLRRPEGNDGLWIRYAGEKWVSAGPAVPLRPDDFVRVGNYAGFPVFARQGFTEEVIYLPTLAGLIAPYRLKD
jgi:hypothetical protein